MGMGGRGGGMGSGMQFGKIGLKLDRMNLHALAERQNEEDVEEVGEDDSVTDKDEREWCSLFNF